MFTLEFWKAALIRAIRTFAESMLAYIGTGKLVLGEVDWLAALSAGCFGAVCAILLSLAGLPEVQKKLEAEAVHEEQPPLHEEANGDEGFY